MNITLGELYFGDLEAYDEARLHREFFEESFVIPNSMSPKQLRNNSKFIITGRKGVGKTAIQMHLAHHVLHKQGYLTQFFRFVDDMKPEDYSALAGTQTHISFIQAIDEKKLFVAYDYRPAWQRVILHKLAVMLIEKGFTNKFTEFCHPTKSVLSSLFEGISKSLTVKLSGAAVGIAAEIGVDFSKTGEGSEVSLSEHNAVAKKLFVEHCAEYRVYFFVDELVFSRLDATDDEIRARAAMVRDLIRTAKDLNTEAALAGLDFHFICSLRPEVRNIINDLDGEIGKTIDGRDVALSWLAKDDSSTTLLDEIFEKKVRNSYWKKIDVDSFVDHNITFGEYSMTFPEFLKTNTWGRPRDIVRLLQAIAKASPNAKRIGQAEIKAGLDEYSRASLKELFDELGVIYGPSMIKAIKSAIDRKTYSGSKELWNRISPYLTGLKEERVIGELFDLGVIQGYLSNPPRYFAAHRGETFLKSHYKVRIHPALWNELGIRSK